MRKGETGGIYVVELGKKSVDQKKKKKKKENEDLVHKEPPAIKTKRNS